MPVSPLPPGHKVVANKLVATIVTALRRQGMTQRALARQLQVTDGNVTGLLSGRRNLTLRTIIRIADALDSDVVIDFAPRHTFGAISIVPVNVGELWENRTTARQVTVITLSHDNVTFQNVGAVAAKRRTLPRDQFARTYRGPVHP